MKRTTNAGLWAAGGFILLIGLVAANVISFDRPGLIGAGIGVAVGLLNLVIGGWVAARMLKRGGNSMGGLAGGFMARLIVLVGLTLLFQRIEAVDATAFALVFMMFFFVYVGLELILVERAARGSTSAC